MLPGLAMPGSFSVQGRFSRCANSIVHISFCYSLSGPSSFFTRDLKPDDLYALETPLRGWGPSVYLALVMGC